MTAALILPILTILALAVAVYRIFAFLRADRMLQPAPVYPNWDNTEAPSTSVQAETLRPRF
ncbi:hypothetical protein [Arthrobacter sp. H14]|uniref:hypothetical protein n=1 Tax=Arthrobacter sp. H14 TaxID=1312959 RepID=UPI00047983EB|nr:hypothetical protein [Arthrobacter sp. H14]